MIGYFGQDVCEISRMSVFATHGVGPMSALAEIARLEAAMADPA